MQTLSWNKEENFTFIAYMSPNNTSTSCCTALHCTEDSSKERLMMASIDEFSRYINLHRAFNFKSANLPDDHAQEKVQLVERKKSVEDKVDMDAEDFIKQKHMAFQLSKWQTFKE
ncbi:hypothetical protein Dimus_004685 [Dionaea muscipula]